MRKSSVIVSLLFAASALGLVVSLSRKGPDTPLPVADLAALNEQGALYRFSQKNVPEKPSDAVAPSLALTASDGTGLTLAELWGRSIIEGPLAYTELRLAFDNPNDRTLEGTFRITLPQGAAISRFAMRIGDRLQEGEVVEKKAARRAYEDFLHRKQDPALLEQAAGNEFSARVFPIPARARKHLVISYSQEITRDAPFAIPLKGLPTIGRIDLEAHRAGEPEPIAKLKQDNAPPEGDFLVEQSRLPQVDALRAAELVVTRVKPVADARAEPVPALLVLVDTSASRALGYTAQVRLLSGVIERLAAEAALPRITVAAFDQGVDIVYEGAPQGFATAGVEKLLERRAFGASSLERALAWASQRLPRGHEKRVLLLTDGVPTAHTTAAADLRRAALALKQAGADRIDAVATGGIRDDDLLRGLVTAGLPSAGVVVPQSAGPAEIARRLALSVTAELPVKLEGARFFWPDKLTAVQPGDEALVYAELDADKPLRVKVGADQSEPRHVPADRSLVERAWAKAKIASLVAEEASARDPEGARRQIISISQAHRVVSPHTSLLVLETEADYARYGIDRASLTDILSVDGGKLLRISRKGAQQVVEDVTSPRADAQPQPEEPELRNANNPRPRTREQSSSDGVTAPGSRPGLGEATPKPTPRFGIAGPRDAAEDLPSRAAKAAPAAAPPPAPAAEREKTEAVAPSPPATAPAATATAAATALPTELSASEPRPITAKPSANEAGVGSGGPGGLKMTTGGSPAPAARRGLDFSPTNPYDGDSFGAGGIGLKGGGKGGGGKGDGVGLGSIGAIGHGAGTGQGIGASAGRLGGDHKMGPVTLRYGAMTVSGALPPEVVQRIAQTARPRFRYCYSAALRTNPSLSGPLKLTIAIDKQGEVTAASTPANTRFPASMIECARNAAKKMSFPSATATTQLQLPIVFGESEPSPPSPPPQPPSIGDLQHAPAGREDPHSGAYAEIERKLAAGEREAALERALAWQSDSPGDVLALVALGSSLEALGEARSAARTYGSIIDLFSSRADLRRFAGMRLERLSNNAGLALALDSFAKAAEQRPDHPGSHHLLAMALIKASKPKAAFESLEKALQARAFTQRPRAGTERILQEDLALAAAAWKKAEPSAADAIDRRLREAGSTPETEPSLRFVIQWETDANDVDFHIYDGNQNHAYYAQKRLPDNGGELYADVTNGYGPECFTVRQPKGKRRYPYKLQAHYFSRGPMGYGMGKLEIIEHDGDGTLTFDERPFIVMNDHAFLELGTYPNKPAEP